MPRKTSETEDKEGEKIKKGAKPPKEGVERRHGKKCVEDNKGNKNAKGG